MISKNHVIAKEHKIAIDKKNSFWLAICKIIKPHKIEFIIHEMEFDKVHKQQLLHITIINIVIAYVMKFSI